MSGDLATLQKKMDVLRENPNVFEIIRRHCGVKDLTKLDGLENTAFNRLKRYVEYYYGIVTCPA